MCTITGSLCRTDWIYKYNQLLRIEDELGKNAVFSSEHRRLPCLS